MTFTRHSPAESYLTTVHWAILALRRYLHIAEKFMFHVPGAAKVLWIKHTDLLPCLQVLLLDLQTFDFDFIACPDSPYLQPHAPLMVEPAPAMPIVWPPENAVGKLVHHCFTGSCICVNFDGSLHKLSFIVHNVDDTLIYTEDRYDPTPFTTNNVAELWALAATADYITLVASMALTA